MGSISPEIKEAIIARLKEIEKERNVEIILAVESGSRAWGFESTDSDYDVRFIYKHDLAWYINVLPKKDVIEYPIVDIFDYAGWDIKKTMFLLNKSNPVLFEWMRSPIVYIKNEECFSKLLEVSKHYFSPLSSIYHYIHMAKGNYREYLHGEYVKAKKYFYVLRPLFACMWIESKKEVPPIEFEILLDMIKDRQELLVCINDLLERKKSGVELGEEKSIRVINDFIEEKIKYFDEHINNFNANEKPDAELLDRVLFDIVK